MHQTQPHTHTQTQTTHQKIGERNNYFLKDDRDGQKAYANVLIITDY